MALCVESEPCHERDAARSARAPGAACGAGCPRHVRGGRRGRLEHNLLRRAASRMLRDGPTRGLLQVPRRGFLGALLLPPELRERRLVLPARIPPRQVGLNLASVISASDHAIDI